jgi:hypothetical protein
MQEDGVSMAAAVALDTGRRDVDGVGVARRRRRIKQIRRRRSPSKHTGSGCGAFERHLSNCWAGLNTVGFSFFSIINIFLGCQA